MSGLWALVWGKPQVDPRALAEAIDAEASRADLDYRTRLLIRDGARALEGHWGAERWGRWLGDTRSRDRIETILREPLGEPGLPLLRGALMDTTTPEQVRQFLRELGSRIPRPRGWSLAVRAR